MSATAESIKQALKWQVELHKKEYAKERVTEALTSAARFIRDTAYQEDFRYKRAMEFIEDAEAWLVYLQDPSIIENLPERNLPA